MTIYSDGAATMKCVNGEYQRGNGGWAWAAIDENDNLIHSIKNGLEEWYTYNEDNKLENLILGLSEGNSNLNKFLDKEVKDFKENIIIL